MNENGYHRFESPETRNGHNRRDWHWPNDPEKVSSEYSLEFADFLQNAKLDWLNQDDIGNLEVGFAEAVINAMKYGNRETPDQPVEVSTTVTDGAITVTVRDHNRVPFEPAAAFNAVKQEEHMLATHGRGIELMKGFYDEVSYRFLNPGNEVTMVKRKKF